MARTVKCTCGNLLPVNDSLAGKQVRCGVCKKVLTVPTGSATDAGYSLAEPEEDAAAPARTAPSTARKAKKQGH